jgi:ABC-type nitrate/sulfonate/bicarbonate transport system ATPase subunit
MLQPVKLRLEEIDSIDATGTIGRVGYMLQKDLLLPWRTVLDNVILGMEIQGVPLQAARDRALPLLRRYGLAGFEHLYPSALSGGMRQRAALLRTLMFDTDVILLDEPFGALDAQTKLQMQEWLLQLWSDFGKTVVFVTHDVEEAIYLSDEVNVMATRPGRIVESIPVSIARPRPRSVTLTPEFILLKERCLQLLTAGHYSHVDEAA